MRRTVVALILGVGLTTAGCGAAPSSRIAVATPDFSVAPSSAAPSRTAMSPAGRTGSPTSADAASSAAAAASASLQSIVDWKKTYVPPSTTRPSTPTPPPLTDAPILTLRRLPNGPTCDYDPALLVPSLAVYADGRVIAPTGHAIGYLCDAVPAFRAGRTDVVTLRAAVEKYLSTEGANVDISKSENVADGGLTRLEYTAADGRRFSVTADALDFHGQLPDKETARVALREVLATITGLAKADAGPWVPSRVMIVKLEPWRPVQPTIKAWPVTVTPELRALLAGPGGGCISMSGPDAATLLVTARSKLTAAGPWTIDRKQQPLAIGVTLEGLRTCSPVVIDP